jgi:hypothetical protein
MAVNELPKLLDKLDEVTNMVAFNAPMAAASDVVADLQEYGPVWTGFFANSWLINTPIASKNVSGTKQQGIPKAIGWSTVAGSMSATKLLTRNTAKFSINNSAPYAGQATDLERFAPRTNANTEPIKPQMFGRREDRRGLLPGSEDISGTGPNSATAELDWFSIYVGAGEMNKRVQTTFSIMFKSIK